MVPPHSLHTYLIILFYPFTFLPPKCLRTPHFLQCSLFTDLLVLSLMSKYNVISGFTLQLHEGHAFHFSTIPFFDRMHTQSSHCYNIVIKIKMEKEVILNRWKFTTSMTFRPHSSFTGAMLIHPGQNWGLHRFRTAERSFSKVRPGNPWWSGGWGL